MQSDATPDSYLQATDQPIQAVARPTDLTDPELQHWTKGGQLTGFSGAGGSQLWRNGDHTNLVANGRRFHSSDPTLRRWSQATDPREGFPGGGDGGQWFQSMPRTVDGAPAPPGSPTHIISVSWGNNPQ